MIQLVEYFRIVGISIWTIEADQTVSCRSSSMARAICSVALPAPWLSNSLKARRSLLCDVKPSTSLESSSVRSVRYTPESTPVIELEEEDSIGVFGMRTDLGSIIVKYHAYLRKMTRYNPTRGGKL